MLNRPSRRREYSTIGRIRERLRKNERKVSKNASLTFVKMTMSDPLARWVSCAPVGRPTDGCLSAREALLIAVRGWLGAGVPVPLHESD